MYKMLWGPLPRHCFDWLKLKSSWCLMVWENAKTDISLNNSCSFHQGIDVMPPRYWWERCNRQCRCSQALRNKFCVGFQRRITKEKPFGLFFGPARQAVIKISRLISIAILSIVPVSYLLKYRLSKDNSVRIYILNRVFLGKYFSDRQIKWYFWPHQSRPINPYSLSEIFKCNINQQFEIRKFR